MTASARRAHHADRIPLLPVDTRFGYLKVRDRASHEFPLTSAAAALLIEDGTIVRARLALAIGGAGRRSR
jgi:CO/xanthine dehydrogenase FAD-binding subunit